MRRLSKTYPLIPHKIKMFAKKTLRQMNGVATGWRQLAMQAQRELDNERND